MGKPFVSDFGLAKWLEREADLTQTLAVLGTPNYMAPEQAAGEHALTSAPDIYSLGAILFDLLTGRPPFRGDNPMEVLRQAAEHPPPRPRSLNRHIPSDLETICLKCLEKNPAARYLSAAELADDLDRFLARRSILARRANPMTHAWRWVRRNPSIASLSTASVALLVSLLLVLRPAPPQKAQGAEKSVAVLPFESLTDNQANAYFANGIQNDIVVNLSKIADLKVIARDSVAAYQGTRRNLREISKTLGVNSVLEGSVRHVENRVRINVQLINATNNAQLWAENYDREMKDTFAIQSDLAFEIASALKAKLTTSETARLKRPPTENGEAYLFYIQASDLFAKYDKRPPDLEKAEQLYEKAIQLDPTFALAYAGLSQVETLRNSSEELLPERRARARAHAEKALDLQPDLPEAHWALGKEYYQGGVEDGDRDLIKARSEFEIAQRGLPNNAEIYSMIGRIERREGKWTQSIAHINKAASLDPNNPERWHRLFYSYELVRDFPAAAEALDHAIALSPNSWSFVEHKALLQVYWRGDLSALDKVRAPVGNNPEDAHTEERFNLKLYQRKYDEAEGILLKDPRENFLWSVPGTPKSFLLGTLYWLKKENEKARAYFEAACPVVEQLVQAKPREPSRRVLLAEAYAVLGRKEDAIREGKRAVEIIPETKDAQDGVVFLGALAKIYGMVGEPDRALPILAHSLATPGGLFVQSLRLHPEWDPLRGDARFQQLLKQYGVDETRHVSR
jgi:serine/threonine-protein kinase